MDLLLALALAHSLAAIAWGAGMAILALILLAARRDDAAAARALPETRMIRARILRPLALFTILTGLALAAASGAAFEAWILLSAALVLAGLVARPLRLDPALARAAQGPDGAPARPALRLAALDLGTQGAALALLVARPGWGEALILAGLLACLLLALALLRSLGDAQPA